MAGVKGKSGGARVGAGRPRRDPTAKWLSGAGTRPQGLVARPVEPSGVAVDVPCPVGMQADEASVWRELAPHATAEGTLTPRTVMAFGWLCRNVVMERKLAASPLGAAGPDHRGMMQRVEAGLARFRLTPDGKPVVQTDAKDEWSEFDQPMQVIRGGKA